MIADIISPMISPMINNMLSATSLFFTSTWNTEDLTSTISSNADQIAIPFNGTTDAEIIYNGTIIKTTVSSGDNIVTFPAGGIKTTETRGTFELRFFSTDFNKLTNISKWGLEVSLSPVGFAFCSNLTITATDVPDISNETNLNQLFRACSSITRIPSLNLWDFSAVTNLGNFLGDAINFNEYWGDVDTGNVTSMGRLHYDNRLYNQSFLGRNHSKVTNLSLFMALNSSYNQVIIMDIPVAINLSFAFQGLSSQNQDITLTSTALVENWKSTFQSFSAWDGTATISVDDFSGATDLTNFFTDGTLSVANTDQLLVQLESTTSTATGLPLANLNIGLGTNSKYSVVGEVALNLLTGRGCTVTTGGLAP